MQYKNRFYREFRNDHGNYGGSKIFPKTYIYGDLAYIQNISINLKLISGLITRDLLTLLSVYGLSRFNPFFVDQRVVNHALNR